MTTTVIFVELELETNEKEEVYLKSRVSNNPIYHIKRTAVGILVFLPGLYHIYHHNFGHVTLPKRLK